MNGTRKKIEDFKKVLNCHPAVRLNVESKMILPENYQALGYLTQNAIRAKAYDKAIADELGLTLDFAEVEEFYRDKSEEEALEWAKQLPDMPKHSYRS